MIISSVTVFSQENDKLTIYQDAEIEKLMNHYKSINSKKRGIEGYRVQIYFNSNRDATREIKAKFLSLYPDIPIYEIYQQPNFKLRVGDCRTRFEAEKIQQQISANFLNSFVVQDIVNPKIVLNEN
jgi:hypothetical protein